MTAILDPRTTETPEPVAPVAVAPAPPAPPTPAPGTAGRVPTPSDPGPARLRWAPSRRDMRLYGAAMFALFTLSQVVIPVPDGPDPVRPLWASALDTVITVGLLALLVGTVLGRRWTLRAGLAVGVPMLTLALSCPLTGHHEYAAWFWVHLAATAAMTALSAVLVSRARAS